MTTPDIEVLRELDGGAILGFYARGHHDNLTFVVALSAYMDETGYDQRFECHASDIRREYWRNVPAPYYDDGAHIITTAQSAGRGAYAVTVVEAVQL